MPTELSLRVESFRVSPTAGITSILYLPLNPPAHVQDIALSVHRSPDLWAQAIASDLQLCETLAPVVTLAMIRRDLADGGPLVDHAQRICTDLRADAKPGSWVYAESGRLLCHMAGDVQKDAATVADRERAAHDQHAQHDGQSEVGE